MRAFRDFGKRSGCLGAVVLMLAGCRSIQSRGGMAAASRTTGPIAHVVVLWSEAVLRQDNMPVAQGSPARYTCSARNRDQP